MACVREAVDYTVIFKHSAMIWKVFTEVFNKGTHRLQLLRMNEQIRI